MASKTDWKLIADGQGAEIVRLRAENDGLRTAARMAHDPAFCASVTRSLDAQIACLTDERDRWRGLYVGAVGSELTAERRFRDDALKGVSDEKKRGTDA